MNIRLGIYEIFSRIIPGGIYMAAIWQLLTILGVITIDLQTINSLSLPASFGLVVAAYILGGAFDYLSLVLFRLFKKPGLHSRTFAAFKQRYQDRWTIDFTDEDWTVLLAFIRTRNMELAGEIERHNAISIMSRNISTGLMLIAGNSLIQFFMSRSSIQLLTCIIVLIVSALTLHQSLKFRAWFYENIYETVLAYRIDLEKSIQPVMPVTKESQIEATE